MKKEWNKAINELEKLADGKNCCIGAKLWGGPISKSWHETLYTAYIEGTCNTYEESTNFLSPIDAVNYIKGILQKHIK